jgi:hypothetical protein
MSLLRLFTPRRLAIAPAGVAVAALLSFGAVAQEAQDAPDDQQVAQMQMPRGPGRMIVRRQDGQGFDRCQQLAERLNKIDKKLTAEQVRDIVAGRQ